MAVANSETEANRATGMADTRTDHAGTPPPKRLAKRETTQASKPRTKAGKTVKPETASGTSTAEVAIKARDQTSHRAELNN